MSDFTANELKIALGQDGNIVNGETAEYYDNSGEAFWHEYEGKGTIDVLGIGVFEGIESAVGKVGEITDYGSSGNTWNNYVILKHVESGRTFRLNGEYDSWDPQGWDGEVQEVESVKKTITVWDVKHDY